MLQTVFLTPPDLGPGQHWSHTEDWRVRAVLAKEATARPGVLADWLKAEGLQEFWTITFPMRRCRHGDPTVRVRITTRHPNRRQVPRQVCRCLRYWSRYGEGEWKRGGLHSWEYCAAQVRRLLNIYSRKAWGKHWSRYGEGLWGFLAWEQTTLGQWHAHLLVGGMAGRKRLVLRKEVMAFCEEDSRLGFAQLYPIENSPVTSAESYVTKYVVKGAGRDRWTPFGTWPNEDRRTPFG